MKCALHGVQSTIEYKLSVIEKRRLVTKWIIHWNGYGHGGDSDNGIEISHSEMKKRN